MGYRRRSRPPGLEGGAGLTAAWRSVIGAGFALPRDAGRRAPPGELPGAPVARGDGLVGYRRRSRPPGLEGGAGLTAAWRSVIGAGFALPRDAGRRPALLENCPGERVRVGCGRPRPALRVEGGAGLTLAWRRVIGAGFALPRDAGLETGAPGELPGAPVARGEGWWGTVVGRALRDSGVVRRLTAAWRRVIGAGFALPRDAGLRDRALLSRAVTGAGSSVLVSRSRAMPVGGPHRENCPALLSRAVTGAGSSVLVSRSRAMPVGDRPLRENCPALLELPSALPCAPALLLAASGRGSSCTRG